VSQYQRQEAIDALGKKVHLILKDGVAIYEFDKMYLAEAMITVFQDLEKIRTERDDLRADNERLLRAAAENVRASQHDAEKRRALVPHSGMYEEHWRQLGARADATQQPGGLSPLSAGQGEG
jgi:hypothetical protein